MSIETIRMFLLGDAFPFWTSGATLALTGAGLLFVKDKSNRRTFVLYTSYTIVLFALYISAWVWRYEASWWFAVGSTALLAAIDVYLMLRFAPEGLRRFDIYFLHGAQVLNQPAPVPALDLAYIKAVGREEYYIPVDGEWVAASADESFQRVVTPGRSAS